MKYKNLEEKVAALTFALNSTEMERVGQGLNQLANKMQGLHQVQHFDKGKLAEVLHRMASAGRLQFVGNNFEVTAPLASFDDSDELDVISALK